MKTTYRLYALTPFAITLLLIIGGCASNVPVAVPCPEMPPVSKWMTGPAKNLYLIQPSSKTQPKTP